MQSGSPWPLHRTSEGWHPAAQATPYVVEAVKPPAGAPPATLQSTDLATSLVKLAALLLELRDQAHLIHLNYEAKNFFSVHAFLKDQYESAIEHFDTVAEHVRALQAYMPSSAQALRSLCDCFMHCHDRESAQNLAVYGSNLGLVAEHATACEAIAAAMRCVDVQNSLAELVAFCRKAIWMIAATISAD